ncbi:MAG: hypothetical protein J1E39_01690 [Eubacterium sp.]|nr:hypothetical protein [Eubacterium sp.]
MKKAFYGSLCHDGIRGGGIYVTDDTVTYKTGAFLPDEYRNIIIPIADIERTESGRTAFLPTVTLYLKGGHR